MLKTDIHEEHEDTDVDASEISKPERRYDAVLAGPSVTVHIKRSVTLVNHLPRLDIACGRSKSYDFRNAFDSRAFPELFNGYADKCGKVTGFSEFGIIIDLSYCHHDDVFQTFELTLLGPSHAEPERSYAFARKIEVR